MEIGNQKFKTVLYSTFAVLVGIGGAATFVKGAGVMGSLMSIPRSIVYEASASGIDAIAHSYYLRSDAPALPQIDARGYIVADLLTGDVIMKKNEDSSFPIASVSKLTTSLTALSLKLDKQELLYPLLLESSNEAAEKIASLFGRKQFIQAMNTFVGQLGMTHTHYDDPSGISPHNVSSASDLLRLTEYIYKNNPDLLALTLLPEKGIWKSNNLFVQEHHKDYLGGKSGFTPEAKGTLVSIFNLPLAGDELRPVAVILLGTNTARDAKYKVTDTIIDYVTQNVYYK